MSNLALNTTPKQENVDFSAFDLSTISSNAQGASESCTHVAIALNTIAKGNLSTCETKAIASLAQFMMETWAEFLEHDHEKLENRLINTRFGRVKK